VTPNEEKVLDHLRENGQATTKELAEAASVDRNSIGKVLNLLLASGDIIRVDTGVYVAATSDFTTPAPPPPNPPRIGRGRKPKAPPNPGKRRTQILAHLRELGEEATAGKIALALGLDIASTRRDLTRMANAGDLLSIKHGWYKLPPGARPSPQEAPEAPVSPSAPTEAQGKGQAPDAPEGFRDEPEAPCLDPLASLREAAAAMTGKDEPEMEAPVDIPPPLPPQPKETRVSDQNPEWCERKSPCPDRDLGKCATYTDGKPCPFLVVLADPDEEPALDLDAAEQARPMEEPEEHPGTSRRMPGGLLGPLEPAPIDEAKAQARKWYDDVLQITKELNAPQESRGPAPVAPQASPRGSAMAEDDALQDGSEKGRPYAPWSGSPEDDQTKPEPLKDCEPEDDLDAPYSPDRPPCPCCQGEQGEVELRVSWSGRERRILLSGCLWQSLVDAGSMVEDLRERVLAGKARRCL